jgi:ribonuclease P protein component
MARLVTLRRRGDFLAAARGLRAGRPGFTLQGCARGAGEGEPGEIRVGYTCSRKVGGAVERNRAKRRLREVARKVLAEQGVPGWNYVLVGRPEATATRPFAAMVDDLHKALERLHGARR